MKIYGILLSLNKAYNNFKFQIKFY